MLPSELTAFRTHIHALLANGDTRQTVADLLAWTKNHRPGWQREALLISADYEKMSRDESKGILSFEQANLRRSQLNDRLLQLTERLADAPPGAATYFFKKHWKKLAALPVALGVLASVAEFTGYSARDIFEEKTPAETTAPPAVQPPVNISTSGDNSPAINAPGGDVRINYGESAPAQKPAQKDSLSKK